MFIGFVRKKDSASDCLLFKSEQSIHWKARELSLKNGERYDCVAELAVDEGRFELNMVTEFFARYRSEVGFAISNDAVAYHLLFECLKDVMLPGGSWRHWDDGQVMTLAQFVVMAGSKRQAAEDLGVGYLTVLKAAGTEIVFDGRLHRPSKISAQRARGGSEE